MAEVYDLIIIGGGPAGATAAIYARRANLNTLIINKSKTAGAIAYASIIENFPGFTRISGKELLEKMLNQAISLGTSYKEEQVVGVSLGEDIKEVITMQNSYTAHALIIATGSMGRKPSIAGEGELLGRGVSYCAVCDAPFFRGKTVAVLGDSEEAAKEAFYLTQFVEKCYLITSSSRLKVNEDHPIFIEPKIEIIKEHSVKEILGKNFVEGVVLKDREGKKKSLSVDGVFVFMAGTQPITDFLGETIKLDERGFIITDAFMQTSQPGVFAAGDVASPHLRQVVIACAQGAIAALSAEKYIRGGQKIKSDWHR